MNANLPIHPVISGESRGPTAWGLSVKQTLIFGVSIVGAFVEFLLLTKAGMSQMAGLCVAAILPLGVFGYQITLVVRKPASYARNWRAWQYMRIRRKPLFEIQHVENYLNENS